MQPPRAEGDLSDVYVVSKCSTAPHILTQRTSQKIPKVQKREQNPQNPSEWSESIFAFCSHSKGSCLAASCGALGSRLALFEYMLYSIRKQCIDSIMYLKYCFNHTRPLMRLQKNDQRNLCKTCFSLSGSNISVSFCCGR